MQPFVYTGLELQDTDADTQGLLRQRAALSRGTSRDRPEKPGQKWEGHFPTQSSTVLASIALAPLVGKEVSRPLGRTGPTSSISSLLLYLMKSLLYDHTIL